MIGDLDDFAEAWGVEPARIVLAILHRQRPDTPDKRAIEEAWAGWRAFHNDARLTVAEADAKSEALEWALRMRDVQYRMMPHVPSVPAPWAGPLHMVPVGPLLPRTDLKVTNIY